MSNRRKRKDSAHFRHSHALGQNFLRDENVIQEIVDGCGADSDTLVFEIGPGEGVLTDALAERAGAVAALELDDRLIPFLRTRFALQDHVEIIHGDILETDLREALPPLMRKYNLSRACIVGNLPYYITTPIIMKLLETLPGMDGISGITVMMQREVADRLIARPGTRNAGKDTGAITYAVQYRCTVRRICEADRTCFYPVPRVDSSVLRLDLRDAPPVHPVDERFFFQCIKAGFMMRRKTLLNSLRALNSMSPEYQLDREQILSALEAAGIDPARRAESLTMEEFTRLADALYENV